MTIKIGDVVDGKYAIEKLLGEGGFAQVFLATHTRIPSLKAAVKVLKTEHIQRGDLAARFEAEARTTAGLRSRNTVKVMDYGVTADGTPYLAMEYINGTSLESLLAARGRLTEAETAQIAMDVLRSLDEAHSAGIVHRDLKPANIFIVDEPGEPMPVAKVLDFGISKLIAAPGAGSASSSVETAAGLVYCTPQYAAPEVLTGQVGTASDLYSLGHVLAEMLDGVAPYQDSNGILSAASHLAPGPVPLGEFSSASLLGPVIARACAKPLAERYSSAREMLIDVQAAKAAIAEFEAAGGLGSTAHMPRVLATAQSAAHDGPQTLVEEIKTPDTEVIDERTNLGSPTTRSMTTTAAYLMPAAAVLGAMAYLGGGYLRNEPPQHPDPAALTAPLDLPASPAAGYLPGPAATTDGGSAQPGYLTDQPAGYLGTGAAGYLGTGAPGYLEAGPGSNAGYLTPSSVAPAFPGSAAASAADPTAAAPANSDTSSATAPRTSATPRPQAGPSRPSTSGGPAAGQQPASTNSAGAGTTPPASAQPATTNGAASTGYIAPPRGGYFGR